MKRFLTPGVCAVAFIVCAQLILPLFAFWRSEPDPYPSAWDMLSTQQRAELDSVRAAESESADRARLDYEPSRD